MGTEAHPFSVPGLSEKDFINAKAFLLKSSTQSNQNLYDQMSRIITKVM